MKPTQRLDEQLAVDLQREGAEAFVEAWKDLLNCIGSKSTTLEAAGQDPYDNSGTPKHHRSTPREVVLDRA